MENKLREIVLDTETTGLDIESGHRIIEIGCVELINRIPTGKVFHRYINPERGIPYHSFKIHGISEEFLEDKPLFPDIALEFLDFISNDILIIHNAEFDIKFLNMELGKLSAGLISSDRVLDTLPLTRKKFAGSPASLSALCKRFDISLENRELHGALIDAQLLAKVYVELTGGLQTFLFDNQCEQDNNSTAIQHKVRNLARREHSPSNEEVNEHRKLLDKINNPLWKKFIEWVNK
ncbi:DNA polymerase III subunit epsilon [Wolbachia pipientis]|uniref:DNA polymerase III subunit epsilon n=1 Tax=Wolbachia pipientis TaxID=955 RepID=UPI00202F64A0|nr:DNA polymerase III subunit epsilon [Wolbachia pipientis]MCM1002134.1 DNA polymerase III subunit epsilon [Wolbachia pipientis]